MNIIAPIDCNTGYGITSYNILKETFRLDNDSALFPIGGATIEPSWDQNAIKQSLLNRNKFDTNSPCLKIWHANDFFFRTVGSSKYSGLTFFEIDKVSDAERVNYNLLDNIIVASNWAKNVLQDNNITKNIEVCPMGVDTSIFNHEMTHPEKNNDKYIFFNIGKWEIRKGHDILLDIFLKAFSKEDNVELWMFNHNPFLKPAQIKNWMDLYQNTEFGEKIKVFPRVASQKQLASAMSLCDCAFFPSRAEGWNNEAIETMAMNKPIIITNYSAHTEYCDKNNSYLIDVNELEPANDGIWFDGYGNWAKIGKNQEEQAIEHLRYVYKNNIRNNPNGLKTAQNLTWEKTAKRIHDIVYG